MVDWEREGVRVLRVGVDDLETGRTMGEFTLPGVCGRELELGVEGLVVCEGLVALSVEVMAGDGRVLEGVDPRDGVVRVADGVDALADVDERLVGVDGLM